MRSGYALGFSLRLVYDAVLCVYSTRLDNAHAQRLILERRLVLALRPSYTVPVLDSTLKSGTDRRQGHERVQILPLPTVNVGFRAYKNLTESKYAASRTG